MPVKTRPKNRQVNTRPFPQTRRRAPGDGEKPIRPPAESFSAELSGLQEVPPILTPASGAFRARLSDDRQSIEYKLTYENLTTPATQAHIHFGQPGLNGGIVAFLCGGNDKPDCPGTGGTVMGRITAADILAIPAQGLNAGDFDGALRIIRSGAAYVNIHNVTYPNGEIRGQIR